MAPLTSQLQLHLLNVGQGEAILIDLPDGSFMLLDGGPKAEDPVVLDAIEKRVKAGRPFRLAGISQWDADHIRGIPAILRTFRPEEFRVPGVDLQLLEEIARREVDEDIATLSASVRDAIEALPRSRRQTFTAYSRIEDLGGVEAHVLSPSLCVADEIRRRIGRSNRAAHEVLKEFRNRASVALWLRYGGRTLLLSGEADGDQYRTMRAYFLRNFGGLLQHQSDFAADWIKLSHHGANENNPDDLFKFFGRAGFVASASAGGDYNHPHPAALKRLHFDYGGVAMCTGLGKGCDRLLRTKKPLDAKKPDVWARNISARKNPRADCYGTITVTVTSNGQCSVDTTAVQSRCPYGGPASPQRSW